jgi:hypothetical protein
MAKTDKNKVSRQSRLRKVLSGMGKHLQNLTALTIAQIAHPLKELEARIQQDIEASDTTDQAKAAWIAQVQAERTSHQQVDPLLRGIKQYVLLNWGDSKEASNTLEDFGYAPRKPRTVKPQTKVAAAAKAKATRTARHTVGPKAKRKITGTAPATTAPEAAETATTPATSANPATPATSVTAPSAPTAPASPSPTVATPRGT